MGFTMQISTYEHFINESNWDSAGCNKLKGAKCCSLYRVIPGLHIVVKIAKYVCDDGPWGISGILEL